SASGGLRTCLFSPDEINIRPVIAENDIELLKDKILESIKTKPRCWNDIRTGQLHMSGIGG
ncbi:MAG: GTP 3',8-cyclase MoaA, partial [Synergistaceae bacterium]